MTQLYEYVQNTLASRFPSSIDITRLSYQYFAWGKISGFIWSGSPLVNRFICRQTVVDFLVGLIEAACSIGIVVTYPLWHFGLLRSHPRVGKPLYLPALLWGSGSGTTKVGRVTRPKPLVLCLDLCNLPSKQQCHPRCPTNNLRETCDHFQSGLIT